MPRYLSLISASDNAPIFSFTLCFTLLYAVFCVILFDEPRKNTKICASILTWLRRFINHLLTYLLSIWIRLFSNNGSKKRKPKLDRAALAKHDDDVDVFTVGENSGKASRSVATYTPGPAGMAYAQEASTSAVSEIGRAKMVRNWWVMLIIVENSR